jgi:hypothetical protein
MLHSVLTPVSQVDMNFNLELTGKQSQPAVQQTTAGHLTVPGLPELRATDSADSEGFAHFAQSHASSYSNIYQPGAQQPQAPPSMNMNTNVFNFDPQYTNMGDHCLHDTSPIHTAQGPRHERRPLTNSNSNIPTPVSMSGPRLPLLSEQHTLGDRRGSVAASVASSYGQRRPHSDWGSSEDCDDVDSIRRNHAYKRSEEPPRNHDGKMTCKHNECANVTFDRKCEWR